MDCFTGLIRTTATLAGLFCLPVICTAVLAGCNGGGDAATVSGKVLVDGAPLTSGRVIAANDAGNTVGGDIQSDGTFRLETRNGDGGIPPGAYRVTVTAYDGTASAQDPEAPMKSLIPLKYSDATTSRLAFEVAAKESKELTLELSASE